MFGVLTLPLAIGGAQATAIDNRGSISGFFIDAKRLNHGFLLVDGALYVLDFPHATFTQALRNQR